jgi:hypothetical protein
MYEPLRYPYRSLRSNSAAGYITHSGDLTILAVCRLRQSRSRTLPNMSVVTFLYKTVRRSDKNCLFLAFSFTFPSLAGNQITYLVETSYDVFSQDPRFVKCIHLRARVNLLGLRNANSHSQ